MTFAPAKRGWLVLLPGPPFRFGVVTSTHSGGRIKYAQLADGTVIDFWMEIQGDSWVIQPHYKMRKAALLKAQPAAGFPTMEAARDWARQFRGA